MDDIGAIEYKDIDLDGISLSRAEYDSNLNAYTSDIIYKDEKPLLIKSSRIYIQNFNDNVISFEFGESSNDFYGFYMNFDRYMVNKIIDESERSLGIKMTKCAAEDLYKSNLQLPYSVTQSPILNVNIDETTIIMNKNKEKMTIEDIKINNEVNIILIPKKLIFHKTKCVILVIVKGIRIFNQIAQIRGYMFTNSSDIEELINSVDI